MQVLGKHKYYCEMCKKQCKDENAFKQHKVSSFHQHKMMEFHQNPQAFLDQYSEDLERDFCDLFRVKYGYSNPVPANKAYNEYHKDPHHTHLNATKWQNFSEFVHHLGDKGLFEVTKEQIGGSEQLMMRMIDKNEGVKSGGTERERKEQMREAEKKREAKELEKMIARANKLQEKISSVKPSQSKLHVPSESQSAGGALQISFGIKQAEVKAPQLFGKKFEDGSSSKEDLLLLQQPKKSVLDKLLHHQKLNHKHEKPLSPKPPKWIRKDLIVKIKQQGQFYKEKARVIEAADSDAIKLELLRDKKVCTQKEESIENVLPGEGGTIMVLRDGQIGSVHKINVKGKRVIVKIFKDNNKEMDLSFDQVCKINY